MPIFTDQMDRKVSVPDKPKRIISLVPSQTELLFDLGLNVEIIGVTKFCIHPKEVCKSKTKIGGTKKLDIDKIKSLNPDLIIGNKEENDEKQIKELMQHFPVWMSDIITLDDALAMILKVGDLVDKKNSAENMVAKIQSEFNNLPTTNNQQKTNKVAYFIWKSPYMVAANNTFINEMLKIVGWSNVFSDKSRYPEIDLEVLKDLQPNVIFLSTEPYPFSEKHFKAFVDICPNAKIALVDGELFSWYGSRLLHSAKYFKTLQEKLSE